MEKIGFKVNEYDPYVTNKMIKGHQFIITWHVNDLKISHKLKRVVDRGIK